MVRAREVGKHLLVVVLKAHVLAHIHRLFDSADLLAAQRLIHLLAHVARALLDWHRLQSLAIARHGVAHARALVAEAVSLGALHLERLVALLPFGRHRHRAICHEVAHGQQDNRGRIELKLRRGRIRGALHAQAEAVHAIRVVHRAQREQVAERRAVAPVVGHLDRAVGAAPQGVHHHGNGGDLGLGALQEAAVAPVRLRLRVARALAEGLVDVHERCPGDAHVCDGDRNAHVLDRVDD